MRTSMFAAAVAACCLVATPAIAGPAAAERGDILVKVRGGYSLRSQSDRASFELVKKDHLDCSPLPNCTPSVKASNSIAGEAVLDFFVSENIAIEASIGGSGYDVQDAAGRSLASAGLITPTLSVLFYPTTTARVRPYIGGGVTYANFYSEKPGELLTNNSMEGVAYSANIQSNVGPVGQVGFDLSLDDKFYINVDGKYHSIKSKITVGQGNATPQTKSQNLSEFVIGVGVGFKF